MSNRKYFITGSTSKIADCFVITNYGPVPFDTSNFDSSDGSGALPSGTIFYSRIEATQAIKENEDYYDEKFDLGIRKKAVHFNA